jgi:hypothetical protein
MRWNGKGLKDLKILEWNEGFSLRISTHFYRFSAIASWPHSLEICEVVMKLRLIAILRFESADATKLCSGGSWLVLLARPGSPGFSLSTLTR